MQLCLRRTVGRSQVMRSASHEAEPAIKKCYLHGQPMVVLCNLLVKHLACKKIKSTITWANHVDGKR